MPLGYLFSNLDDFIAPCGVCRQTMVEVSIFTTFHLTVLIGKSSNFLKAGMVAG